MPKANRVLMFSAIWVMGMSRSAFLERPYSLAEGSDGPGEDNPGNPTGDRVEACGGGPPHPGVTLTGQSTELQDRPAERMVSCPPVGRVGVAGLRLSQLGVQGLWCAGEGTDEIYF